MSELLRERREELIYAFNKHHTYMLCGLCAFLVYDNRTLFYYYFLCIVRMALHDFCFSSLLIFSVFVLLVVFFHDYLFIFKSFSLKVQQSETDFVACLAFSLSGEINVYLGTRFFFCIAFSSYIFCYSFLFHVMRTLFTRQRTLCVPPLMCVYYILYFGYEHCWENIDKTLTSATAADHMKFIN